MIELLPADALPPGFGYPAAFVRVVELRLIELEPWQILGGDHLARRHEGLRLRYPARRLVPFARRQDSDDVACFDVDRGGISVIHDFADAGWEQRDTYPDVDAWLRQAVEDLIEFGTLPGTPPSRKPGAAP
ncbi:hypothetical protein [Jiangella alba]|uniref:Uncharacterized protein n=1 Tax=Jiangella alba TaxID=561176 RepID=A0A1H5LGC1_9ACTN|nr:hypothetical protein [Jiangella alba]SEE76086.1 hypothetical protein SAMN04488561_2590 [Jiangella alba]